MARMRQMATDLVHAARGNGNVHQANTQCTESRKVPAAAQPGAARLTSPWHRDAAFQAQLRSELLHCTRHPAMTKNQVKPLQYARGKLELQFVEGLESLRNHE